MAETKAAPEARKRRPEPVDRTTEEESIHMQNGTVLAPVGSGGEGVGSSHTDPTPAPRPRRERRRRPELTTEQRAERRERLTIAAGYVLLVGVVAVVGAMSWTGLTGFGHDALHLGRLAYAVPVSLDIAAMASGALALRSVVARHSAAVPRLLSLAFVIGSAAANWYQGERHGGTAAALYFGGMSVASWLLWDVVLRQIRKTVLVETGAVERPLPRFRIVRWARYPRETFAAWSLAVRYGLTRPEDALSRVWQVQQSAEVAKLSELPDGVTKADAVRLALAAVGSAEDVPGALEWLAERGMKVDRSYAYDIARKSDPAALPQLPRSA